MFSVDEYIEKIHYLPLEISRHLHLIQELDKRAMKAKSCMEQLQQDLRQSLSHFPPPPQTKKGIVGFSGEQKVIIEKLDKTQTEYYHLSEEKCKITEQIYSEIEQQQEELHNETKRFCGENGLQNSMHGGGQSHLMPLESESAPIQKKLRKIEEKRNHKIHKAVEGFEGIVGSPSKAGSIKETNHQPSSLNSSIYEGSSVFAGSHQNHNGFEHSENSLVSKPRKRQTKSKYASNRNVVCCNKEAGDLVICDKCSNCYHLSCIGEENNDEEVWLCKKCRENSSIDGERQFTPSSKAQHRNQVSAIHKHSKITHH